MNPNELLNAAEAAIQKVDYSRAFRWTVWVKNGEILCTPTKEPPADAMNVMNLSAHQVHVGLLSCEWDLLQEKLAQAWKELKL